MNKYGFLMGPLMLFFLFLPSAGVAGDTNIRVNVDPRGMSDEIIKMEDHKARMIEQERQRLEQERIDSSNEALQVGEVYFEKGDLENAAYYYQTAVQINEANLKAHERLIEVNRLQDEQRMRIDDHYQKALLYLKEGVRDKAVDELVAELKNNPDNQAARIKLNEIENSTYPPQP